MTPQTIFIFGQLMGLIFGGFFMALWKNYAFRDYIYKSKDVRDAYQQGYEDGREDRHFKTNYNHQSDLSH